MFTPCPHCGFLVAGPARQRPAACPRCGQPLEESAHDAPAAAGADLAPPASAGAIAATAAPPATSAAPRFAAVRRRTAAWPWAVVAALVLLLLVQVVLADRARLAADARWRPLLESACAMLRCSLPPWREPSAFVMLDRRVSQAGTPDALRVDATFRNDARWPQPWPALQLSLSDADGRVLGSGVFTPEQYLGHAPREPLAPGQSAQVTFLVREPAPGTVAFAFEFR